MIRPHSDPPAIGHHAPRTAGRRLMIEGPAGALELQVDEPVRAASGPWPAFAVVCHPHPLFGGTLENKVVHTLARTMNELGLPSLRFNFRGVGASAGAYADGIGETEDALAVIAEGRSRHPDALLWLLGFSFGAAVALRAAGAARPHRLVAVAPAVDRVDVGTAPPPCPWAMVLGDADEVVSPAAMLAFAARSRPPPSVYQLSGAGHFFHGRLPDLRDAVLAFTNEKPG